MISIKLSAILIGAALFLFIGQLPSFAAIEWFLLYRHGECVEIQSLKRKGPDLARLIHEDFYYNRRYTATTNLTAGGLAAQSVNILFQVCFPPSRLRAPVSLGVSAVSSRTRE
jgi:hypothetical protein